MKRLVDEVADPRHERLAAHLRQIAASPPPAPAPRRLWAIGAAVESRPLWPRRWPRMAMAALTAALVTLWLAAPRRAPLPVPAPTVASAEPAHVEPAVTRTPAQTETPAPTRTPAPTETPAPTPAQRLLHLGSGDLVVRAVDRPTAVEVPGGRVVVPPGGRARIEVRGYSVRVAAWRGDVTVTWNHTTLRLSAGDTQTLGADAKLNAEAPLSEEAALLSHALRRLRVDHDAAGALQLLDEHDRRFPDGTLASEAAQLRLEAADSDPPR
jgi:hypothetical protein